MIKAILFDCWGTLFYTKSQPHPAAFFAHKVGKNADDYAFMKIFERNFMTRKYETLEIPARNTLLEIGIEAEQSFIKRLSQDLEKAAGSVEAYPEALSTLKKLKGKYKLGVLTNTDSLSFEILEKKFEIGRIFDAVITSYEIGLLKPDDGIFAAALEKLGTQKNETLMVGDSPEDDVEAAEKFGMRGVLIDRRNAYPDYRGKISSLAELDGFK